MADKPDKQPAAPAASSRGGGAILAIVVPALAAAAATFGGTFWSTRMVAARCGTHEPVAVASAHVESAKPPGPTLALDAFLLNIPDANKKAHPSKVTMAVEFAEDSKIAKDEAALKALTPRLRDAVLSYLRRLTYEELSDPAANEQLRSELIFRVRAVGANGAERVLITDLVVQ